MNADHVPMTTSRSRPPCRIPLPPIIPAGRGRAAFARARAPMAPGGHVGRWGNRIARSASVCLSDGGGAGGGNPVTAPSLERVACDKSVSTRVIKPEKPRTCSQRRESVFGACMGGRRGKKRPSLRPRQIRIKATQHHTPLFPKVYGGEGARGSGLLYDLDMPQRTMAMKRSSSCARIWGLGEGRGQRGVRVRGA